jgi:dTDP-glucose 4,6-dehydratase
MSVPANKGAILITGGAGFIGSNFVLHCLAQGHGTVLNLDCLTYAGNLGNLRSAEGDPRHVFCRGDIRDGELLRQLLEQHRPWAVVHLAAESHVDRSIHDPGSFVSTNVEGTWRLLEASLRYWKSLSGPEQDRFRFVHISTDEVFGSLGPADPPFDERTPYRPNSPYAASKAASDHMARAYHHTYRLPVIITNCSNNYGPHQFPEKLIPLTILNALAEQPLPVYGDGQNVRDWLYVGDHCRALEAVLARGTPGAVYTIGGDSEKKNLEVVRLICGILDELRPLGSGRRRESLIRFVDDRPGHDRRYAISAHNIRKELGWEPQESFATGLRKTVLWYLENQEWARQVTSGAYRDWITLNYASRSAACGA